jgi:hypothetical protein
MLVALGFWSRPNVVRDYRGVVDEEPVRPAAPPDARPTAAETPQAH